MHIFCQNFEFSLRHRTTVNGLMTHMHCRVIYIVQKLLCRPQIVLNKHRKKIVVDFKILINSNFNPLTLRDSGKVKTLIFKSK